MMPTDMKLPELGENIEGGDVLRVMVKPGDAIKKDQPVLELETDKATIEVPSSATGVVKEIKIKPGEKVKVGQTIFVVDENGAGASERRRQKRSRQKQDAPAPEPAKAGARVGGQKPDAEAGEPAKAEKRKAEVVEMKPSKRPRRSRRRHRLRPPAADAASIPAAPSARRLARELGVNIQDIQGSGPGGRISMDDVTAYARRLLSGAGAARSPASAAKRCPTSANGERSSGSR